MTERLPNDLLNNIAQQYGTPVYIYDAEKIIKQYQNLKAAFKGQPADFFFACKALTNINILKLLRNEGANVDCSSVNEVKIAVQAGFPPERILYTSNGISFEEIVEVKSFGVHINIDSLYGLEAFGQAYGHNYPVGIRIRPNILAGGNLKISTGHDNSKFGIPVEQLGQVLKLVDKYNLHIHCLHLHTGSDIYDADVFIKEIEVLFELMPQFKELGAIDLGGGFKVAYKDGDKVTDIDLLAQKVKKAFEGRPYHHPLRIWFEPGKYMVSEAGYLIAEVTQTKETSNTTFVSLDTGFNHLIRPMFYDAYHYIWNISNPNGETKNYSVVGNICETDTFAWDRELAETKPGDLLAIANAGAYGFEMASNFNSRFKPAEVLVIDGEAKLIRKRDSFDDLMRNIVEVL